MWRSHSVIQIDRHCGTLMKFFDRYQSFNLFYIFQFYSKNVLKISCVKMKTLFERWKHSLHFLSHVHFFLSIIFFLWLTISVPWSRLSLYFLKVSFSKIKTCQLYLFKWFYMYIHYMSSYFFSGKRMNFWTFGIVLQNNSLEEFDFFLF